MRAPKSPVTTRRSSSNAVRMTQITVSARVHWQPTCPLPADLYLPPPIPHPATDMLWCQRWRSRDNGRAPPHFAEKLTGSHVGRPPLDPAASQVAPPQRRPWRSWRLICGAEPALHPYSFVCFVAFVVDPCSRIVGAGHSPAPIQAEPALRPY